LPPGSTNWSSPSTALDCHTAPLRTKRLAIGRATRSGCGAIELTESQVV
jgi:hypothetical protein